FYGDVLGDYTLTATAGSGGSGAGTGTGTGTGTDSGTPAGGPTPIAIGATVTGSLTGSDPETADGYRHDCYIFSGTAGQLLTISMSSADLDTLLYFGPATADACAGTLPQTNDDSNGTTNSELIVTLGATGD